MNTTSFLSTFAATLFARLNPLGMLPVFMGYTANLNKGVQWWLALLVSVTVVGLMLLFLLTGNAIGTSSGSPWIPSGSPAESCCS